MKELEEIANDIRELTELTRIIAMSGSDGMNYTHDEVSAAFRNVWKQLQAISDGIEEHVSSR